MQGWSMLEQDNKKLKLRVDQVERENRDLKRSLYELSARHSVLVAQIRRSDGLVDAGALLAGVEDIAADEDIEQAESAWESGKLAGAAPPSSVLQARGGAGGGAGGRDSTDSSSAFQYKYELREHTGPVYSVQFAPSGLLIASGSFDKTVRIWDINRRPGEERVHTLDEHSQVVADVSWSADSESLLSGSFDQTVRAWAARRGQLVSTWTIPKGAGSAGGGCVQRAAFQPDVGAHLLLVATTSTRLFGFDARVPQPAAPTFSTPAFVLENDAMVNTFAWLNDDGWHVLTGDKHGVLRTWDLRKLAEVERARTDNGEQGKPISHIALSAPVGAHERADGTYDDGRYISVNSFDNVLRVYAPQPQLRASDEWPPRASRLELVHALRGHLNRNWPIRSSWYVGRNYHRARPLARKADGGEREDGGGGGGGGGGGVGGGGVGGGGGKELDSADDWRARDGGSVAAVGGGAAGGGGGGDESWAKQSVHDSMLLATGSSDSHAYVFDVGGARGARLLQRLEGHRDRVNACSFHQHDPLLATASADWTIKIWGAKADRFRNG